MRSFSVIAVGLIAVGVLQADDWPQWLGPDRASVWREQGIIAKFPDGGLKAAWRAPVGLGYAGPAVANGRVFVADYDKKSGTITNNPGGVDKLEGSERLLCFDAVNGKLLWKHEYEREYRLSYPAGPRCTPTVDGDRVYALGAEGDLLCLKVSDGTVVWHKELTKEYKTKTPIWGFSAHPLVAGDLLFCVVGGEGSVAVAFDKYTGKEVWRALSAPQQGYCPPTMIEHAGVRQLLIWHPRALNSLNPKTGEVYWSVDLEPSYNMSITAPRQMGKYLYASGIGQISALMELDDSKPAVKVVWRGKPKDSVYCANSTPFLEDGMIYGADIRTGALMAASLKDGARAWQTTAPTSGMDGAQHGTAFIVKQADRFFLFSETGDLIVAKLSPKGYEEISRARILEPTNTAFGRNVLWSHPAFANQSIYARNDEELVCVKLTQP